MKSEMAGGGGSRIKVLGNGEVRGDEKEEDLGIEGEGAHKLYF